MSHDASPKSRVITWIGSVLGVLLLYVATWPAVEIKSRIIAPSIVTSEGGQTAAMFLTPPWVERVYLPMHFLKDFHWDPNSENNLVGSNFNWWSRMLK